MPSKSTTHCDHRALLAAYRGAWAPRTLEAQAERMPRGVEVDPEVVARLELRPGGAGREHPLLRRVELVDGELQVQLLRHRTLRPGRRPVVGYPREADAHVVVAALEDAPVVVLVPHRPAGDLGV